MPARSVSDFEQALERLKGRYQQIGEELRKARLEARALRKQAETARLARVIIQEVGQQTQAQLSYHLSDLISAAMQDVFDDPYKLKVEFVVRRNKTECDLLFERDGQVFDPMSSSGGGPLDVAAFALRAALWSLAQPGSRNVLLIDEPFRNLASALHGRAARMMHEISAEFGLQIIMVSHSPELIEGADRVFEVIKEDGASYVNQVEG